MPAFVLVPASPSDIEEVVRVQFAACAYDVGFSSIFPKGATLTSVTDLVRSYEETMENDPTYYVMVVKDAMSGEIASYAIWHFFPARSQEDIDEEMLHFDFALPKDANREVGRRLVHNSTRKRHEVVATHVGPEIPYACTFSSSLSR
jgi:hypothetical protein